MFNCSSEIASPNRKVMCSLLEQGRCMMYFEVRGKVFCGTGARDRGNCFTSRRCFFVLQVLPTPIKSELWLALWLVKLTWLANSVVLAPDTEIWERATNKQLLSNNATTLPQSRSQHQHKATPWALGGISAVYRSLQSVTGDNQRWRCGRIYPDYTASIITNRH